MQWFCILKVKKLLPFCMWNQIDKFIRNVWITAVVIFVISSLKKFLRMSWPDIWIIIRTLHWRSSDILQDEGNNIKVDIKKAKRHPNHHKERIGSGLDVFTYFFLLSFSFSKILFFWKLYYKQICRFYVKLDVRNTKYINTNNATYKYNSFVQAPLNPLTNIFLSWK